MHRRAEILFVSGVSFLKFLFCADRSGFSLFSIKFLLFKEGIKLNDLTDDEVDGEGGKEAEKQFPAEDGCHDTEDTEDGRSKVRKMHTESFLSQDEPCGGDKGNSNQSATFCAGDAEGGEPDQ